jgi:dihydroneopterin aldolase
MGVPNDRILLAAMRFEVRLGVTEEERATLQPIEVDVEMAFDLAEAGRTDDLARTVDYGWVFGLCREIAEGRTFNLLEALAESIAAVILDRAPVGQVRVRVRKLRVPVEGRLEYAGVEIVRSRPTEAG